MAARVSASKANKKTEVQSHKHELRTEVQEFKRRRILEQSRELFFAQGYEATTLDTIAGTITIDPSASMGVHGNGEVVFITNNSAHVVTEVVRKLQNHAIDARDDDVITSAQAAATLATASATDSGSSASTTTGSAPSARRAPALAVERVVPTTS